MNEQETAPVGGGMVFTGEGVTLYRLMTLRSAIRLEAKGIKLRRRSLRLAAAHELGLAGRPSFETVLAKLDERIAQVQQSLKPGEVKAL